jgi:hypothetical protein
MIDGLSFGAGALVAVLLIVVGVYLGQRAAPRPDDDEATEEVNEKGLGALLRRKPPRIDQESTE